MEQNTRGRPGGPYEGMRWDGRRWIDPHGRASLGRDRSRRRGSRRLVLVVVSIAVLTFGLVVWWEAGYQESQRPFSELVDLMEEVDGEDSGLSGDFPAVLAKRSDYSCAASDAYCYGVSVTALADCPNGVYVILQATTADGHTEAALRGTTSAMARGESRVVVAPSPGWYPRLNLIGAGCLKN